MNRESPTVDKDVPIGIQSVAVGIDVHISSVKRHDSPLVLFWKSFFYIHAFLLIFGAFILRGGRVDTVVRSYNPNIPAVDRDLKSLYPFITLRNIKNASVNRQFLPRMDSVIPCAD